MADGGDRGISHGSSFGRYRNLHEEFADVIAWLTTIANVAGVDLSLAIQKKVWNRMSRLPPTRMHLPHEREAVAIRSTVSQRDDCMPQPLNIPPIGNSLMSSRIELGQVWDAKE